MFYLGSSSNTKAAWIRVVSFPKRIERANCWSAASRWICDQSVATVLACLAASRAALAHCLPAAAACSHSVASADPLADLTCFRPSNSPQLWVEQRRGSATHLQSAIQPCAASGRITRWHPRRIPMSHPLVSTIWPRARCGTEERHWPAVAGGGGQ